MNISPINLSYRNISPKFGNSDDTHVCRTQALTKTLAQVPSLLGTMVTAYEADNIGEVDKNGSTVYKGIDANGNSYFESRTEDGIVFIGNDSQQLAYNLKDTNEPISIFPDINGTNAGNRVTFNPVNNETRVFLEEYGETLCTADGKRYDFDKSGVLVEPKCNFIA